MGLAEKYAKYYWNKQLNIIRRKGIIAADEEVVATVGLFKRPQWVFLLGWIARFLQKQYLFVVTDHRVLLVHIPAFLVHGFGYHKFVFESRPCCLRLSCKAKAEFHFGAKVVLPRKFAAFVGRPHAFVVFGLVAQSAFDLASQSEQMSSSCYQARNKPICESPRLDIPIPRTMSLVRFRCPSCKKALKAKREMGGRRCKCTGENCRQVIKIPVAQ